MLSALLGVDFRKVVVGGCHRIEVRTAALKCFAASTFLLYIERVLAGSFSGCSKAVCVMSGDETKMFLTCFQCSLVIQLCPDKKC